MWLQAGNVTETHLAAQNYAAIIWATSYTDMPSVTSSFAHVVQKMTKFLPGDTRLLLELLHSCFTGRTRHSVLRKLPHKTPAASFPPLFITPLKFICHKK
jgi:hypothetical protein